VSPAARWIAQNKSKIAAVGTGIAVVFVEGSAYISLVQFFFLRPVRPCCLILEVGSLIRIEMKSKTSKDFPPVAEIKDFLPGGRQFDLWIAEGLVDFRQDSGRNRFLFATAGRPTMQFGSKISIPSMEQKSEKVDDVYFEIFKTDKAATDGFGDIHYSVRFVKPTLDYLGGFALSVSEGVGVGKPAASIVEVFQSLAARWSGLYSPDQLFITCSDVAVEQLTHSWPAVSGRAWVPGYCWVLLLTPSVIKLLGGLAKVTEEAPVSSTSEIQYGRSHRALLCSVAPTPGQATPSDWEQWRSYLAPVLGEANHFPRTQFAWIHPDDLGSPTVS
jgi:hypothetical protein